MTASALSERYVRAIQNYFSANPTPTDNDIEVFAGLIEQRLREFRNQQPDFDFNADWDDFLQALHAFREDPRGFMTGAYAERSGTAAPAPASAPVASAPQPAAMPQAAPPSPASPPPAARAQALPLVRYLKIAGLALALFYVTFSSSCWMPFSGCADSGWLPASSASSNTLSFDHELGVEPSQVSVFFRHSLQDPELYSVTRSWAQADNGNPVTIVVTRRAVRLNIVGGMPLHGTWSPGGGWKKGQTGFFRVFVRK